MLSRCILSLFLALVLLPRIGTAAIYQVPVGARPLGLGAHAICGPVAGGWHVDATGRSLRAPSTAEAIGRSVAAQLGTVASCHNPSPITLLAIGRWPQVDASSVVLYPDEGRLEARGHGLRGAVLVSRAGTAEIIDTCFDPKAEPPFERCTFRVVRGGSADPAASSVTLLPAGARPDPEAMFFDSDGRPRAPDTLRVVPARVIVSRIVPNDVSVDLSGDAGEAPLVHPEAVAAVECAPLTCEIAGNRLVVRGSGAVVRTIDVRARLIPHVFFQRGEALDAQPPLKIHVTHCPMAIISGPPVRGNEGAKIVVRLEGRCVENVDTLRFIGPSVPLRVLDRIVTRDAALVVLKLGSYDGDELVVTATRGEDSGVAVANAHASTRPPLQVRATLEIAGFPHLGFIPTNRPAWVHVSKPSVREHFELLSVDGIYTAARNGDAMTIQGDANGEGLTALHFALRNDALEPELRGVDLAVVTDPLQRELHEANVPVPLGAEATQAPSLLEFLCGTDAETRRIRPGEAARIPFHLRDSCRLVLHRERIPREMGTQKLHIDMEVISGDGAPRGDAHLTETVRLRNGPEARLAWVHGVASQFDRIVVRASHEADDAHYVGAQEVRTGAPAVQWSTVVGTARARLYATSTIPAGLYRFGDREHSGTLSLNFGVISRLTWLDSDGHEGFLGLEGGVMVFGIANSTSSTGKSLTEVGAIAGVGFSVPIINRASPSQASINLHAWFDVPMSAAAPGSSPHAVALIVGPSISIGNVGASF